MPDHPRHNPTQTPQAGARRLVLGSASPRRAELLRQAGFAFEQRASPFDEAACDLSGLSVAQRVLRLAEGKATALAEAVAATHPPAGSGGAAGSANADGAKVGGAMVGGAVVLTADTLISADGQPLGKPADAADARRMLERLLNATHQALTGVCLLDAPEAGHRDAFVDVAEVLIEHPGRPALEAYLASGEWRGKAGAYNLAELKGRWRFHVAGDPTTVVGLPMRRLTPILTRRTRSRETETREA